MYLDEQNAQKIADHFKGKFQVVVYVGCWSANTVNFALFQDKTEQAGIEITIRRVEKHLEKVEVLECKRLRKIQLQREKADIR